MTSPEQREEPDEASVQRDYNRVLEYYVDDDASGDIDLVGLIAYSLYKRQKRDWVIKHRSQNDGCKPTSSEIAAVTTSYLTEDLRNTLRARASDLLSGYADTYVQALEPTIRIDALNTEMLRQARDIQNSIKNQSNFWSQVGTGLVATVIWTLLVTGLVLTASLFGSDIIDAASIFNTSSAPTN